MNNYYEPIYSFEDKETSIVVIRRFGLKQKNVPSNIKAILELINKTFNNKCLPLASLPRIYQFKTNIVLERLVHLLKRKNFIIQSQILNYNGLVVGIIVEKGQLSGYLPCFPSAPIIDLNSTYTWIDDSFSHRYELTIDFLNEIYKLFNGNILCKPVIKIIDDDLIVGILTQTNQFVPIEPPVQDTFGDDLEVVNNTNYAIADKISLTNDQVDADRVEYIRKIRLESSFFNVFRNTIRIMLGQFNYHKIRKDIENVIDSDTMSYLVKLRQIDNQIRTLTKDKVVFSEYKQDVIQELDKITNCYLASDEDCSSKSFCISKEDNNCALVIPKTNLINNQDNEKVYYGRIADEILRYNRIKSFIFKPKAFLTFSNLRYNLKEDEVILLQSLLTQDYFDDLIPAPINTYISSNSYDTTQPLKTQAYSMVMDMEKQEFNEMKESETCGIPKKNIVSHKWRNAFPEGSIELEFINEPSKCTFELIFTLIKQSNPQNMDITIENLKEILVDEYLTLGEYYENNILQVLQSQGKNKFIKQVSKGQITLGNIIMQNEYYATNLDIWILAIKFNIALIFFSGTKLIENNKSILVAHSDNTNSFYFIKSPGVRIDNIPKYRLIVTKNGNSKISTTTLSLSLQEEIKNGIRQNILTEFLANFKIGNKSKKKKLVLVDE